MGVIRIINLAREGVEAEFLDARGRIRKSEFESLEPHASFGIGMIDTIVMHQLVGKN